MTDRTVRPGCHALSLGGFIGADLEEMRGGIQSLNAGGGRSYALLLRAIPLATQNTSNPTRVDRGLLGASSAECPHLPYPQEWAVIKTQTAKDSARPTQPLGELRGNHQEEGPVGYPPIGEHFVPLALDGPPPQPARAFAEAWARGRAMSLEEAVAEALVEDA